MPSLDQTLERSEVASSQPSARSLASFTLGEIISQKLSLPMIAALSVASALLIPSRMLLSRGEPDDSSVFAYIGWAMKHGLMPYRDVWDHKGPLLYYLNFAGMSLRSTSTLGIGLLEVIAFAVSFFLIYRVVTSFASRLAGLAIAVFSVAFVAHFYSGGNMTESWAMLPLSLAHYACWRWSQRTSQNWCAPVIASCFVCIFFLRPNMAAYPAIALMVLLYATGKNGGIRASAKQLAIACAVGIALSALIVAPLYRSGVFHDFVTAYFGYNAAYSGALSWSGRLLHTNRLMMQLFATAIAILGTAGWAFGIGQGNTQRENAHGLPDLYVRTLLWSLPFEIAAVSLSGRDYPHYLLPLFPTLVVLAAWFLTEFEQRTKVAPGRRSLAMAFLLGLCPFTLTAYYADFLQSTAPPRSDYLAAVRFIQRATTASDRITVVGGPEAAYINFLAQRRPGARFVYDLPLIDTANPVAFAQRREFLCELRSNKPAVIVSASPLFPVLCASAINCPPGGDHSPLSEYGYKAALLPDLLKDFVGSQYHAVHDPQFGNIQILLRNDVTDPSQRHLP